MVGLATVLMAARLYGSYGVAGALSAANAVAWAIGTAFLAHLVDRHGQRRIMLPTAMLSAASLAGMLVLALVHAPLATLFACTIVSGFTSGSPGAMVRARWNSILPSSSKLHTAYALESTLDEVCFVVGPVLATWLATSVHPVAGLVGPIVFGAGGAMIFYSLRATEPPVIHREVTRREHNRFLLLYPGLATVVGVGMLTGCLFGSIDIATVAATTAWDLVSTAGLILAAMSLGSGIGGLLYGSRGWTSPLWKRFILGVCLLGVLVCSLFLATGALILGICGFVAGFFVAPTFINANALISHLVPQDRLTEGLAWLGTSIGIGVSIGATVSGHIIDLVSYHGGFAFTAGCGLLAAVLALGSWGMLKRITSATTDSSAAPASMPPSA